MKPNFYNLKQAAVFLDANKQSVVIHAANSLPICFHYRGNLGIVTKECKFPQGPACKFDGILRSLERVSLNRINETYTEFKSKRTTSHENRARIVNVADDFNRQQPPPALAEKECFTRLDDSGMPVSTSIPESEWLFHIDDLKALKEGITSGVKKNATPLADDTLPANWIEAVRAIATEYIQRHKKNNLFPSQDDVCEHIEETTRARKIYSDNGKPLAAGYIQRNAIQGDWWKSNKP